MHVSFKQLQITYIKIRGDIKGNTTMAVHNMALKTSVIPLADFLICQNLT